MFGGQHTTPFGVWQIWAPGQHTPFKHVVPVGQQTSPVDDRQGGVTIPWEFTQRQAFLPSTFTHL